MSLLAIMKRKLQSQKEGEILERFTAACATNRQASSAGPTEALSAELELLEALHDLKTLEISSILPDLESLLTHPTDNISTMVIFLVPKIPPTVVTTLYHRFELQEDVLTELLKKAETLPLENVFESLSTFLTGKDVQFYTTLTEVLLETPKINLTKRQYDVLLILCSKYSTKPIPKEEASFISNLFALLDKYISPFFAELEGYELMAKFIRSRHQMYPEALSVVQSAVKVSSDLFLESGLLKLVFPLFNGKAMNFKIKNGKVKVDKVEIKLICIGILYNSLKLSDKFLVKYASNIDAFIDAYEVFRDVKDTKIELSYILAKLVISSEFGEAIHKRLKTEEINFIELSKSLKTLDENELALILENEPNW